MKLSRAALFLLIGFFAAQTAWYYPNLPARVAAHFNAFGEPDGWTSKNQFLIFEAVILLLVIGVFALLPRLLEKTPDTLLNIPNKDYWLAAERRTRTFEFIRDFFEWFAVALLALLIGINQLVYEANTTRANLSPWSWAIIGAFVVFVVLWMIKFTGRFKIKI